MVGVVLLLQVAEVRVKSFGQVGGWLWWVAWLEIWSFKLNASQDQVDFEILIELGYRIITQEMELFLSKVLFIWTNSLGQLAYVLI